MTPFVHECRKEWKRLGVPDLLADEMAAELEADLAEAETEGVAAAEILGEGDPRQFAEAWARERGVVSEPPPLQRKSRKRLWIAVAVALLLVGVLMGIAGVVAFAKPTVSTVRRGQSVRVFPPARLVHVPALVGLQLCHAYRLAAARHFNLGFHLTRKTMSRCRGNVVIHQRPSADALVPRHWAMVLRTRPDPVRVPNLVGRSEGAAENTLNALGLHVRYDALPPRQRLRLRDRRVVAQIPAAGQMLQPPHAVTVRLRGTKS
jgi:hypothetical protein